MTCLRRGNGKPGTRWGMMVVPQKKGGGDWLGRRETVSREPALLFRPGRDRYSYTVSGNRTTVRHRSYPSPKPFQGIKKVCPEACVIPNDWAYAVSADCSIRGDLRDTPPVRPWSISTTTAFRTS